MPTKLPLDALEMALWTRARAEQPGDGVIHHSDAAQYKTECVRHEGPWRGVDDLELATLNWVHWFNETRLHSSIGHVPSIEHEQNYYRQINPQQHPPLNPARFSQRNSLAIASNESLSGRTKTFTDPRLCAAIVDRLTCGAHTTQTGTYSYRLAPTRSQLTGSRHDQRHDDAVADPK